jgi:predicted phage terminase large subunit-like protein
VRAVISTPPQHTKTTTLLHGMAWLMRQQPEHTNAYISYATDFARSKSRQARRIAEDAKVPLDKGADRLEEWRTVQGGGMLATGIGGPLTGHGINGLLLVDDPVKNRQEAESALIRERHWEWFNDVAFTRLHPRASAIICMTRWHPDDLAGRLIERGWERINLSAINDAGEALWPERYPVEALKRIRAQVGEYTWASLYMGSPRPRGGALFREPTYYDELPSDGYRQARGFDLAYSARKSADYSVILLGRHKGGVLYLEDCWRQQVESPVFAHAAKLMSPVPMHIYAHGVEQGVLSMFKRDHNLPIVVHSAADRGDKFARAQPAAAAWNAGRIRIPRNAPWLEALLSEVLGFTGVSDPHDDQVDSLAALWDALDQHSDWDVKGDQVG